jgi:hypothetical protein
MAVTRAPIKIHLITPGKFLGEKLEKRQMNPWWLRNGSTPFSISKRPKKTIPKPIMSI